MNEENKIHKAFEPLTKVIAYVFGFMITATLICFLMVLYLGELSTGTTTTVQPDVESAPAVVLSDQQQKGKELFKTNCASCHRLKGKAIGPALGGVTTRLEDEWLYPWIKNSTAMIKSGDPYAVKIYEEYNQIAMNSFPQLTDDDIAAILSYTETTQ